MPRVIQLPADSDTIFSAAPAPAGGQQNANAPPCIGTPYALISFLVKQQLDANPKAQLYVTGHRCVVNIETAQADITCCKNCTKNCTGLNALPAKYSGYSGYSGEPGP